MYYKINGYNEEGKKIVAMPVQAASASMATVRANAAQMLADAGHKCVACDVERMGTPAEQINDEYKERGNRFLAQRG
jgi:hypothetical protein